MQDNLPSIEAQRKELEQHINDILTRAKNKGADSAQASAGSDVGLTCNVREQAVDTIEFHRDKSIGITVYFGKRKGTVSTTDLSPAAIEESVEAACRIAQFTEADLCCGLAEPDQLAKNIPDLQLYHPWNPTPEEVIEKATQCEAYGLNKEAAIINSEGAYISTHTHVGAYGNTHGFLASYPSTRHSMGCVLLAEQKGKMQRDYEYTVARSALDLDSTKKIGEQAALNTVKRLGARKINTTRAPIIFSAKVSKSLFSHFLSAVAGSSLYRKNSFLLESLGKKIFPEFIELQEQPHLLKGLGSAPFDAEGVKTQSRKIIESGILNNYILSTYSAKKLGLVTTGNAGGVHNVQVTPTSMGGLPELLKQMQVLNKNKEYLVKKLR